MNVKCGQQFHFLNEIQGKRKHIKEDSEQKME